MTTLFQTNYRKDLANRKLFVERSFDAPLATVWKAWTDKDILDQWWAPRPWKAKTKSLVFQTGGHWLYAMSGPDGETHWSKAVYRSVDPQKGFHGVDHFCDEEGNPNLAFASSEWKVQFVATGSQTLVKVELSFESEAAMKQLIEMGFEQGFAMAHTNLDELLAKK